MTRREMLDELIERVESELDELSNAQLTALITEYEHSPILGSVVESIEDSTDDELEDDEEDDGEEELPLIDDDWDENALDDEE